MDNLIFSDSNIPERSEFVGNKAYNLFLGKEVADVPSFVVLNAGLMNEILKWEENQETEKVLRALWFNKLSLLEHVEEIKERILSLHFPPQIMETIKTGLTEKHVVAPFSVRSSSVYEDGNSKSAPGVFESFLMVNDEDLELTIKKCWASNFSIRSLFYFGNEFCSLDDIKMGVIIQNMQEGNYAGIMFTINPVTGEQEYVVELVTGYSELLTDGAKAGSRIVIDPERKKVKNGISADSEMIYQLACMGERLQERFACPVDIEWSYKAGRFYLIQVRPVSVYGISETEKELFVLRSISEIDDISSDNTGIGRKFERWKGKKQHFSRACDRQNIKHLMWYFVKNFDEKYKSRIQEVLDQFSGEYVTIAVNETLADVVKRKEEVCDFMEEYSACNPHCIISFREVPINELSVISNYIPEKGIYMEVIDGILKGLKTGEMRGTIYEYDFAGNRIAEREYREKMKYTIEFPSGNTCLVPNDKIELKKYEKIFQTIAVWTKKLYEENQMGAVEWWICDKKIYAADISVNRDTIQITPDDDAGCISDGSLEGYAYVIDEKTVVQLKDIAFGVGISVDRIDDSVFENHVLSDIKNQLIALNKEGHVILCIERPHLGVAPLLDHVSGVVFEEASMLCHLSVMLREKKIPAYTVGGQFHKIKTGQYIDFTK